MKDKIEAMKHAVAILAVLLALAANCWGQTSDIFLSYGSVVFSTNYALAHVFTVTTNTVTTTNHPKQFLNFYMEGEQWQDFKAEGWGHIFDPNLPRTRDNPDLRIIECREIVTARLEWRGKPFTVELENNLLRRWEENWVKEPPVAPAGKWVPGPVQTNFSDWVTMCTNSVWHLSESNLFGEAITISTNDKGIMKIEFPTNWTIYRPPAPEPDQNTCQHEWELGCGKFGCLAIHPEATRHCKKCGKVD